MDVDGTPLERAKKRLLDCEAVEAKQAARIADLKKRGLNAESDEKVLAVMRKTTELMREDFIIEQQRAGLKP